VKRNSPLAADQTTQPGQHNYHRPLVQAVYAVPFIIITACFIDRAFANDWPAVIQIGFSVFVLLLGGASTHRALQIGIDVASSGVAVVNLMRTQRLAWDEVESFDIGKDRGLWASITVIRKDGKKIPAAGLRLWGGDPNILMPDLESLRAELAQARRSTSP
jgi:Bacterial PH domain